MNEKPKTLRILEVIMFGTFPDYHYFCPEVFVYVKRG
jgi:hypothetical protein